MQGPGGPGEDVEGGFEQSGWQAPYADEDSGGLILDSILAQDALLIGRKTYDIWVKYWPHMHDAVGDRFNSIPKYVASRSLSNPEWAGTTVVRDVPSEVAALKDVHGDIRVWGSGELMQTLFANDLVDQIDVFTYPVVLGAGKRVFREGTVPSAMELVDGPRGFSRGVVLTSYRRIGSPEYAQISPD